MNSRRKFLVAGLAGGAVVAGTALLPPGQPLLGRWLGPAIAPESLLGRAADARIATMQGVEPVARGFLASQAGPPDVASLEHWLAERLDLTQKGHPETAAAFDAAVAAAIGEDFRAGRRVEIDGWQLSETEAHLAALRYLRHGESAPQEEQAYADGTIVAVEAWGPQGTEQGVGANVQPDGHSGLWFRAAGAPSWLVVEIDGERARTVVSGDVVTSGLYGHLRDRILETPGEYPIVLVDDINRRRQLVGHFVVTPPLERALLADGSRSRAFCPVDSWGPQTLRPGRPENPQPDGSEGIWIRVECAAARTQVHIDGKRLPTAVDSGAGLVTARLGIEQIARPRKAEISLHDPETGESLPVGTLVVSG